MVNKRTQRNEMKSKRAIQILFYCIFISCRCQTTFREFCVQFS